MKVRYLVLKSSQLHLRQIRVEVVFPLNLVLNCQATNWSIWTMLILKQFSSLPDNLATVETVIMVCENRIIVAIDYGSVMFVVVIGP